MKGGLVFTLILFFVAFNCVQAQTQDTQITKKYEYGFSGKATQQELDRIETDLYQIKTITQVKITYKPDSFTGMLFFTRSYYPGRGEQSDDFNAADIKRIITDAGLVPGEFKEL
ncbi:hypothetical protein DSECCO2_589830 [anaerobic digester metagenome]